MVLELSFFITVHQKKTCRCTVGREYELAKESVRTSSAVERIPFSLPTMELELDLGELDLTSENAEFDFDDFDGKLGALPPCCVLRVLCVSKTLVKTILSSFYFPLIHGCLHSCVHALLHANLTHANTAWYSTSVARSPSV